MTHAQRWLPLIVGFAVSVLVILLVGGSGPPVAPSGDLLSHMTQNGPAIDIQKDGPLLDGRRITLDEAKASSKAELPVPPTNEKTDERTAIWIDDSGQIAFVWESGMRYYINRLDDESNKADIAESWEEKAAKADVSPAQDERYTTVREEPAIGLDGAGETVSNLTFMEQDFMLQFVSPDHSLEDLKDFANAITYEG